LSQRRELFQTDSFHGNQPKIYEHCLDSLRRTGRRYANGTRIPSVRYQVEARTNSDSEASMCEVEPAKSIARHESSDLRLVLQPPLGGCFHGIRPSVLPMACRSLTMFSPTGRLRSMDHCCKQRLPQQCSEAIIKGWGACGSVVFRQTDPGLSSGARLGRSSGAAMGTIGSRCARRDRRGVPTRVDSGFYAAPFVASFKYVSTSSAWPSGFTFSKMCLILPSGPMMNVVRATPITFFPYMFFSCITP
jgi:hypothetical protein